MSSRVPPGSSTCVLSDFRGLLFLIFVSTIVTKYVGTAFFGKGLIPRPMSFHPCAMQWQCWQEFVVGEVEHEQILEFLRKYSGAKVPFLRYSSS